MVTTLLFLHLTSASLEWWPGLTCLFEKTRQSGRGHSDLRITSRGQKFLFLRNLQGPLYRSGTGDLEAGRPSTWSVLLYFMFRGFVKLTCISCDKRKTHFFTQFDLKNNLLNSYKPSQELKNNLQVSCTQIF